MQTQDQMSTTDIDSVNMLEPSELVLGFPTKFVLEAVCKGLSLHNSWIEKHIKAKLYFNICIVKEFARFVQKKMFLGRGITIGYNDFGKCHIISNGSLAGAAEV